MLSKKVYLNLGAFVILIISAPIFAQQVVKPAGDDPDIAMYRIRFKPELPFAKTADTIQNVASKVFIEPKEDVTKKLNRSLDSVYVKNKQIKYSQGYRILVYSGTDKVEMSEIRQKVYKQFRDIELYTQFKAPDYRITFGDYIDKIQAHNVLVKILPSIPGALIIQDQINIHK
ncbi:MAG: hypothetical protein H7329_12090 [Opitutaceae bacterium]|nr:hypothetical protein [Cytophagales bacterium]